MTPRPLTDEAQSVLADSRWRVASKQRPPHDLMCVCRCGVSGEKFEAQYRKETDSWFIGSQQLVFGRRTDDLDNGPDVWKPKNKLKRRQA
jgi:hypothetical protein